MWTFLERIRYGARSLWTRRYAADPNVIDRTIQIEGEAFAVIGVMPPAFNFPWNEVKLWLPMRGDPATTPRDATSSILVGRLATGWTADAARDELAGIQRQLGAAYPDVEGRFAGVSVKPLREALNFLWPIVSAGLIVLLGAVTALLLVACLNVATLSLARASTRSREVGVRLALGAGRSRIARQLMTEHLILGVAGGALGLALTWLAVRSIGPALPESLYRIGTASIDARVLRESGFQWTISSLALGAFGMTALLLAALGLYGVIAYSVAERRRELAIRLVIGAHASQIRPIILGDGLRLTAFGVVVGLVLAVAASRALASLLVGVDAFDPVTIGGVLLVFSVLGVATTARLAVRAAATSPQHVLREE